MPKDKVVLSGKEAKMGFAIGLSVYGIYLLIDWTIAYLGSFFSKAPSEDIVDKDGPKKNNKPRKSQRGKKKQKRKSPESLSDVKEKPAFLQRQMLYAPPSNEPEKFRFTIMSYNVLAQVLVKRDLYSSSDGILKWKPRFSALKLEISFYDPTILCLQEVDVDYYHLWNTFLTQRGYAAHATVSNEKKHCLVIAYKKHLLHGQDRLGEQFGSIDVPNLPQRTLNNGSAFFVLHFTEEAIRSNPYLQSKGLIIGTTHLYWHPNGCFIRAKQANMIVDKMCRIKDDYSCNGIEYSCILAGDFNTEPFDAPYLLMTQDGLPGSPELFDKLAESVILSSVLPEEEKAQPNEELTTSSHNAVRSVFDDYSTTKGKAISLYALGYNANLSYLTEDALEPEFTNWTPAFKGTLDYIFVVAPKSNTPVTGEGLEKSSGLKLLGLLRLPTSSQMQVRGLPYTNWSPSDHFSIMAELELCLSPLRN